MGETDKSSNDVRSELSALGDYFQGNSYHIVLKNCNHFSDALCQRLTGNKIPGWVNRLANLGSLVSCCLPKNLGVAHPDSSDIQSQSTLGGAYSRSGAASFRAFAGQGLSLGAPQVKMGQSKELDDRSTGDRRALLANAAMARFSTGSNTDS
eukprot:CAMPEP_0184298358 /NCGR_PEP_ID=MMETSP1049-20130417/9194_1 /TAXON_ID=77928 /ORGANISM="Proteomonas sulcata, Strain CCMP704" /LENGTH=151 /DNA_ID=CAMNT_0026608475 /DNA_START=39 /DNA_END=494 /DNA_ORIENTATION=+